MSLHPSIIRAYDIRGIVGETLHEDDAFAIGRAFGTYVIHDLGNSAPKIAVGYDGRKSSPALKEKLVEGIASTGAEVIEVGIGPSPMLYFAVKKLGLDGGVMITGSHNPPTHNGFKFMLNKRVFFGEDIAELGRVAESGSFIEGEGSVTKKSVFDDYVSAVVEGYESSNILKVAWDPGNGAAGDVVAAAVKKLPGEHILLNEKIDGSFPAHHPDPSEPENLKQLIEVVKNEGCDLGVAFDGDGDRVGAVDGQGRILFGDQLMVFFARDVLEIKPGATIIADVKASQSLFDFITKMGGKPLIWKTGH